jgi:hypothetical protein
MYKMEGNYEVGFKTLKTLEKQEHEGKNMD